MSPTVGLVVESYLFSQVLVAFLIFQLYRRGQPHQKTLIDEYIDIAPVTPTAEIREVKVPQKRPARMGRPPGTKNTQQIIDEHEAHAFDELTQRAESHA